MGKQPASEFFLFRLGKNAYLPLQTLASGQIQGYTLVYARQKNGQTKEEKAGRKTEAERVF